MLKRFLVRDLSIALVAVTLWLAFARFSEGEGFVADFVGWVAGLGLFACAYLAHEWSHYLGGLAIGSRMKVGDDLGSAFLFSFESEGNTLGQFVVMSLSGFVATAAAVAFFYQGLPDAYFATRVARGGVVFLAFLGIVLEMPLLLYGIATRSVPKQAAV